MRELQFRYRFYDSERDLTHVRVLTQKEIERGHAAIGWPIQSREQLTSLYDSNRHSVVYEGDIYEATWDVVPESHEPLRFVVRVGKGNVLITVPGPEYNDWVDVTINGVFFECINADKSHNRLIDETELGVKVGYKYIGNEFENSKLKRKQND